VAVAVARRCQLRARVIVFAVKRSANGRPTYRFGARSELVVEALIFGMARFAAHRTGRYRVLGRVLVSLLGSDAIVWGRMRYVSANSSGILLALIVVGSAAPPLVRPFCPSRTRR